MIQIVLQLTILLFLDKVSANCIEGDIQLDNSTSPPIIMLCSSGVWGYVCGREQVFSPWTLTEVGIACQQLGLIRENTYTQVPTLRNRISTTSPVHFQSIFCAGSEKRLIDCSHSNLLSSHMHNRCRRNERYRYAAVTCTQKPIVCEPGELKIENDTLIICAQGEWHTLCAQSWTTLQATVACRQMGLNPVGSSARKVINTFDEESVLSIQFHCEGYEDSLSECSSSRYECDDLSNISALTCGESQMSPNNLYIDVLETSVRIGWDYDTDTIQSDDVSFTIVCTNDTTDIINTINDTTVTVNGLVHDIIYTCCVMATGVKGESESVCGNVVITDNVGDTDQSSSSNDSSSPVSWIVGFIIGSIVTGTVIVLVIFTIIICKKRKEQLYSPTDKEITLTHNQPGQHDNHAKPSQNMTNQPQSDYLVPVQSIKNQSEYESVYSDPNMDGNVHVYSVLESEADIYSVPIDDQYSVPVTNERFDNYYTKPGNRYIDDDEQKT